MRSMVWYGVWSRGVSAHESTFVLTTFMLKCLGYLMTFAIRSDVGAVRCSTDKSGNDRANLRSPKCLCARARSSLYRDFHFMFQSPHYILLYHIRERMSRDNFRFVELNSLIAP